MPATGDQASNGPSGNSDLAAHEQRLLVVGGTLAALALVVLLHDRDFEVDVAPSPTMSDADGPRVLPRSTSRRDALAAIRRRPAPVAVDGNDLGVRVAFAHGEIAYYDLVVHTQDRRIGTGDRVLAIGHLAGGSPTAARTGLREAVALARELRGRDSITAALTAVRRDRSSRQ